MKIFVYEKSTDTLLRAKFDNYMSTSIVDNPDQWFLLFQHLLGYLHSYSSPHSIWKSPRLHWKILFNETAYQHSFERKICQLHEYFYHRQSRSMIPSLSAPTRMLTLLLQPSFYLKKSSTTLKNTFHETAYPNSFERKIWQRQEYFFRRQRDQ